MIKVNRSKSVHSLAGEQAETVGLGSVSKLDMALYLWCLSAGLHCSVLTSADQGSSSWKMVCLPPLKVLSITRETSGSIVQMHPISP